MKEHVGKAVGITAMGLGLVAFMIAAPSTSPLYGRTTNDANAQGDPDTSSSGGSQSGSSVNQGSQNGVSNQGSQSSMNQTSAAGQNADSVVNAWPDDAKQAARKLIDKYGQPNGVLDDRLIWINNGQFKQTVVMRDGIEHNFPTKHLDYVKQTVALKVPVNKIGDIAKFDGSCSYERTRGLLTCEDQSEDRNFLALNLANDVAQGKKTVDQARSALSRSSQLAVSGKSSSELEGLNFSVDSSSTGDPDRASSKSSMSGKSSRSGSSNSSPSSSPNSGSNPSSGSESTSPSGTPGTSPSPSTPQNP